MDKLRCLSVLSLGCAFPNLDSYCSQCRHSSSEDKNGLVVYTVDLVYSGWFTWLTLQTGSVDSVTKIASVCVRLRP